MFGRTQLTAIELFISIQVIYCYSVRSVPDIAHVILLLKGIKGAAKSILDTEIKRIVDPSEIELLILNKKRSDFSIDLTHNCYCAYDNVRKIPKWLCNVPLWPDIGLSPDGSTQMVVKQQC